MIPSDIWNDKDLLKNEHNEKKYIKKLRKELLKAEERRRVKELKEVKAMHTIKEYQRAVSTTKILTYFILINCTVVEAYSMWVMYRLQDLSALYSLIGAVITESISYAVYCAKSFKENNAKFNLAFEREKFMIENEITGGDDTPLENTIEDDIPEDDDHSGDIPQDYKDEEIN